MRAKLLQLGICAAAMVLTVVWLVEDSVPPSWDQAWYLDHALHHLQARFRGVSLDLGQNVFAGFHPGKHKDRHRPRR